MEIQRKYGAALSYLNIIIKNAVTFLYTPFLLNTVGQADYGLFQMTNSVVMSLSLLSIAFLMRVLTVVIGDLTSKNVIKHY